MKIENRIIVRRLVAGILLIILSLYTFYRSYVFSTIPSKYSSIMDAELKNAMNGNCNALFVFGILILAIGLMFAFTSNKRPHKWIENTIALAFVLVGIICGMITGGVIEPISRQLSGLGFILVLLGLTWSRKGFKGMPFVSNKEASTVDQPININDEIKSAPVKDTSSELRELKKLFEDDVITQEEFDAKKKQILKL